MRPVAGWGTTSALLVIVVIALALADRFLAKIESAEVRENAQQSYLQGRRLMAQGSPAAALPFLTTAHSLERENSEYELQLAAAMTAAGRLTLAEPLLDEVLTRQPNSGPANLMAARWRAQARQMAEAEAHYHRAIYGVWPARQQDASRLSARFELADLMARNDQKQELIGELISLQAAAPADSAIQKRLASLFLVAGAPGRAAEVYRTLLKHDASDGAAYEGLGEAEIQEGNYSAAGQAFFRALTRDPGNQTARQRVLTLAAVTGLDPTPRLLTSAEKYRRSVRILELTRAALDQCATPALSADLVRASEAIVKGKPPAHATNEMAEEVLQLAVRLWQTQPAACHGETSDQAALRLIMKKVTS